MNEIIKQINQGVIDLNEKQSFFSTVIKGFMFKMNNTLKLRDKYIPHIILNTGDDIMYLEVKGYDYDEPVSNEDYIYNIMPRCMVQVDDINVQVDQLSSYSRGEFVIEHDDDLFGVIADFRRVPLKINMNLKYYFDSFTDAINVAQQVLSKCAFVNNFEVSYLGQNIISSFELPEGETIEKMIEFDGLTMESKNKTMSFSLEILTNYPVILNGTVVKSNSFAKEQIIEVRDAVK
jgi:hypothetical protein